MISYVFDVDGVLCNAGEKINPAFSDWFTEWSKNKEYYLLTGSDREKTITQIGKSIPENAKISFHCLGNSIWIDDDHILINQFKLKLKERLFLENLISSSKFKPKTGNHIQERTGSVNVSLIGHDADLKYRETFEQWDKIHKDRDRIINAFTKKFPRFDIFKGGKVSLDICLRGAHKGQCCHLLDQQGKSIVFFGDRTRHETEIDYPFARLIGNDRHKTYQIDFGYQQTWDILKQL